MKRLGIVVALPEEARALLGHRAPVGSTVPLDAGILVAVCGMGAARAAAAAEKLAAAGVAALLSWGTAGGLDPALEPGALLLPTGIVDEQARRHSVDPAWHARLRNGLGNAAGPSTGSLLSVIAPLASAADKQAARRASGAVAVDMESAAVAGVATTRKLPFAVLRVVVDAAGTELPNAVQVALDANGRLRPAALGGALLRRPRDVIGLLRLARDFNLAEGVLRSLASKSRPTTFWAPPFPA